jgi:hypothetical protein
MPIHTIHTIKPITIHTTKYQSLHTGLTLSNVDAHALVVGSNLNVKVIPINNSIDRSYKKPWWVLGLRSNVFMVSCMILKQLPGRYF